MRNLLLISGLLALAGCGAGQSTKGDEPRMTVGRTPADQVIAAIRGMYEAFKEKSLDGVAPFMTEDSTCYDAATSQLLVGRKAVLDHFGAILARHAPGEKWESTLEDMKVTVSDDLAIATYKVKTAVGGGHALAAVTHVFRREGDAWKACHLHRSWNLPPK
jgi:ketosteroid isomerase-like protein